jgi:Zn-dependent peptidase ImmA (M78 family)
MDIEQREIESLAKEYLIDLGMWGLPVDPFLIARRERIRLIPGTYGACFDGRLEYHPHKRKFLLFYADESAGNNAGRIRFTLGHELGHFNIPHHRDALLHTLFHNSQTGFISNEQMEREADWFAAALLMPEELFRREVKKYRQSVCTLEELMTLADRMMVSITAAAIRYCAVDMEATSVVMSKNGRVIFHSPSYSMKRRGYSFVPYGSPVPPTSIAKQVLERPTDEIQGGKIDAEVWYENRDGMLWEDSARLGSGSMVISYMTPAESD